MNKKLVFQIFILLFLSSGFTTLQAQTVIDGTVKDAKGNPLSGVSISVKNLNAGTVSNTDGSFRLTLTGSGNTEITASSVGFADNTQQVNLSGGTQTINFILTEAVGNMNDVIVTATNARRTNLQMPMSVASFNSKQLSQTMFNSQADLLRTVPGITAEGGGGEVAANIFIRGLPSAGQYQFTPLEMDGMPVLSTMGMNSSAPDVYFRPDLGIANMEFAKGGSATLYGVGSVAGIINYISKTGTDVQKTVIETEGGTPGKAVFNFNTGGPLNKDGVYYNMSGTYRYDRGPIVTGTPSAGYQLRGNIKKVFEHGSFTVYGQYIDDQVQYYSPYPLTAGRKVPLGRDGKKIQTLETSDVSNITVQTPAGIYQSVSGNVVMTKGGYIMADLQHDLSSTWKFDAKIRVSNYKHQFNFFNTDGSGVNPLTQNDYLTLAGGSKASNAKYTYADDGNTLNPDALVLANTIIDRIRPLKEMAGQINVTKTIAGSHVKQNINIGTFLSHSSSGDYDIQIRYLSEFNNDPRVINLTYADSLGNAVSYTKNGVVSVPGYTNRIISSNKIAAFLTDEMSINKFTLDMGVRVEHQAGNVANEHSSTAPNAAGINVAWGNGTFDKFNLHATDWAAAVALGYQIQKELNVYANFSRGYFFPQYNGYNVTVVDGVTEYPTEKPEHIMQGEAGIKYGDSKFSGTLSGFYVALKNRLSTDYLTVNGALEEVQQHISSRSYGAEATFDWEFLTALHLNGSGTYQHATYTMYESAPANVGDWLERQPRLLLNYGLRYDNNKLDLGFSSNYNGKRYGNANNAVLLEAYSIFRADAGYTFRLPDASSLRIGAGVLNVFNSRGITEGNPRAGDTQTNSGDYFVGRPILPRLFYAKATLTF